MFYPLRPFIWILLLIFSFNGGADTSALCQIVFKSVKRRLPAKVKAPVKGFLVTSAAKHPSLKPFVDKMIEEKAADVRHITPNIDFAELTFVRSFIPEPVHIHGKPAFENFFKTAVLDGEKVFLKLIIWKRHLEELSNIRALREKGLRTLFKGITQTDAGSLYMVSRFQEGALIRTYPDPRAFNLDKDYKVTENTYRQLWRLRERFIREGIVPEDLQFLLSREGDLYIIDFEQWFIVDTRRALSFLFAYRTSYGFQTAEQVIRRDFAGALRQENIQPAFASVSSSD